MVFKGFRTRTTIRFILLFTCMFIAVYSWQHDYLYSLAIIFSVVTIGQLFELFHFITLTNRKLSRFLESVRYSDFISGFSGDSRLGSGFKELNFAINDVLEAFRKARSDKEENLLYLNTVVEHVSTGLLSFDSDGNVGLINATAKKFIGVRHLRNIEELIEKNSRLYKMFFDIPPGKSSLFKTREDIQLSIHATEIRLKGKLFKLVALQNIQPELQKKELEAWQNLTRVLRHEIMNSITPISSLTSTLKSILQEDLEKEDNVYKMNHESVDDLQEGIKTIEDRSRGLIKFINAYRDYTSIPLPDLKEIRLETLFEHVHQLMKTELQKTHVTFTLSIKPEGLTIVADEELIEQVLINLIKNGLEAVRGVKNPVITLSGKLVKEEGVIIAVRDNGHGIVREALERIFVPFYTTKKEGSGIGLALSRQIMQLHHGMITVESEPDQFTEFTLRF